MEPHSIHMAKSGTRIQVFFQTDAAERIQRVADHEGVSLSRVVGQAMEHYATTGEWQSRLAAANAPREALMASIADLPPEKQALILQAIDQ